MDRRYLQGDEETSSPEAKLAFKKHRCIILGLILMALFSVLPFYADDMEFYAGGLEGDGYPVNTLGKYGTYLGRFQLLSLGLATYGGLLVALVCSLRRLIWRQGLKNSNPAYFAAILLCPFALASILAINPETMSGLTATLNLRSLPGGLVGWRLCAPQTGWLYVILNQVGCYILFSILLVICLVTIWHYDWELLLNKSNLPTQEEPEDESPAYLEPGSAADGEQAEEQPLISVVRNPALAAAPTQRPETPPPPRRQPVLPPREEPLPPPQEAPAPAPVAAPMPKPAAYKPNVAMPEPGAEYQLPPLELLNPQPPDNTQENKRRLEEYKSRLQSTLDQFRIDATVVDAIVGPQVTMFVIETGQGVRIDAIGQIQKNICKDLEAMQVRCLMPIPGTRFAGVEVPNARPSMVSCRNLLQDEVWLKNKQNIPLLLGRDINNKCITVDLSKAPHVLVAGTTGSGKSVCVNLMLLSLIYKFTPEELKLIIIDPKIVEFSRYKKLPHLVVPIITDMTKASLALRWAVGEMKERYTYMAAKGVTNIKDYNALPPSPEPVLNEDGAECPDKIPYLVVIVDEMAQLMAESGKEVESYIAQLAAMARAVGVHVVLATQRPDTKTITGTIKGNLPTRIALKVSTAIDSRVVIDSSGAEALIGNGDMLFVESIAPVRIQGGYVDNNEVARVVEYASSQATPVFDDRIIAAMEAMDNNSADAADASPRSSGRDGGGEDGSLYERAVQEVLRSRKASISYIQRIFHIGYNRAAELIDQMEENGVIGPAVNGGSREIYFEAGASVGANHDFDDIDEGQS